MVPGTTSWEYQAHIEALEEALEEERERRQKAEMLAGDLGEHVRILLDAFGGGSAAWGGPEDD